MSSAAPLAAAIARAAAAAAPTEIRELHDARPVTLDAVTLDELAGIRADLVCAQRALHDLLWAAADATSDAPVCPIEAQRLDIERHGAELRAVLQLCAARIDGIRALVGLRDERRARRAKAVRR